VPQFMQIATVIVPNLVFLGLTGAWRASVVTLKCDLRILWCRLG
jgi:hypothetical protein